LSPSKDYQGGDETEESKSAKKKRKKRMGQNNLITNMGITQAKERLLL
jgi:uncharacterized protein (DUF1919 family)